MQLGAEMNIQTESVGSCTGCGVKPGQPHINGCDLEVCASCGQQKIGCECENNINLSSVPWSGEFPGLAECREFGFYCINIPATGWVPCEIDEPGAREDLNRLADEVHFGRIVWSVEQAKFIAKAEAD